MCGAKHQRLNEIEDILSKLQASGIDMFTIHIDCDLFLFDYIFFNLFFNHVFKLLMILNI